MTKIFSFLFLLMLGACAKPPSITFTGFNLHPEIKTIKITNFGNEASEGPPNLEVRFSEEIRDYYLKNTPLAQISPNVSGNGDIEIAGKITSYLVAPLAAGANALQSADRQRLTMVVKVEFTNYFEESKNFEQNFSFYEDFDADQNLTEVEDQLLKVIFDQIIVDIFNKTVADW